jgi:hypothetical protein
MRAFFKHTAIITAVKLLLIAGICLPQIAISQVNKPGSIEYLKFCNGYKELVLGADIKTIRVDKLNYLDGNSRPDEDACFKYEYRDSSILQLPDSSTLDLVAIRTFNDKIINIYLFFKRSRGYSLLNGFLNTFGTFTDRPDNYSDIYNWTSNFITLSLRYQMNTDLGIAIYTSKTLEREMAAVKTLIKKQQEAANLSALNPVR